jgi:hypothetical protein
MSGSMISVTVQANPNGYDRSGTIRITAGNAKPYIASIFQGGPKGARNSLRLVPGSLNIDAYGSKEEVVVTTNAPGGWTASTTTPWLSLNTTRGKSGEFFRVSYEPNPTPNERVGVVTVQAGSALPYRFLVTQEGSPAPMAAPAAPAPAQPDPTQPAQAAPAAPAPAQPDPVVPAPAQPAPVVPAPAQPDPTPAAPAQTAPGVTGVIELDYSGFTASSAATTVRQHVTTNEKVIHAVSSDPTWLTPLPYTGNNKVAVTLGQNKTGKARTAQVTYTAGGESVTFTVTQRP